MLRPSYLSKIVYSAVFFNIALCFIFTRGFPVTETWVVIAETCILGTALASVVWGRRGLEFAIPVACFVACNFLVLWLFRQEVDVKGLRDILIIVVFFLLGLCWGSYELINRILITLAVAIAAIGVFEWLFLQQFVAVFDIYGYYRTRGTIAYYDLPWNDLGLFGSGIRPQGRGLLSFLGDHRVSSVFLEPVSMGNFAVILAAWGLAHDDRQWRKIVVFLLAGALFTVAADARFASATIVLLVLARLSGGWRYSWLLPAMPIVVIAGLIGWAMINASGFADDTFSGRLLGTGLILSNLDARHWLGVDAAPYGIYDAGYAYAAQTFGLAFLVISWAAFCLIPTPSEMAMRVKFFAALYITLLLCVSGTSLFSIKTGPILWLMIGTLARLPQQAFRSIDHDAEDTGAWHQLSAASR